jgi:Domain of unknown function (DUF4332)
MTLKGIAIWILGFFSLLSGANVINATIMWFNLGPTATFQLDLVGGLIGGFPVYAYTLISVLVTLAFLAATAHKVVSELSVRDQIIELNAKTDHLQDSQETQRNTLEDVQSKVSMVDENIDRTSSKLSKELSNQGNAIKQSMEASDQNQQKILDAVQGRILLVDKHIDSVKKTIDEQATLIQSIGTNLADSVRPQLTELKDSLGKMDSKEEKIATSITNQRKEIEEIKLKLEKLESSLITPQTLLTSQSNVEDVKGIGPNKGTELREIGIKSAGDLIMADPKVIAEKMGSSDKTVEKLQGRAQLSMIPGLKEKDLLLLEELNITDRKSLAKQDSIDLAQSLNAIFKVNLAKGKVTEGDRPTVEEIDSWVKFTRA